MAQADTGHLLESLHLNQSRQRGNETVSASDLSSEGSRSSDEASMPLRPPYHNFATSQDTIRPTATPPVDIPASNDSAIIEDPTSHTSYIDQYMHDRVPSVSFNNEIKLDSGHHQSMHEPLEKPSKPRERGRSLFHAMAEAQKSFRAHSESERSHYDSLTGRHLPKYSSSPPRDQARVGEGRFPLLQTTVDALARESQPNLHDAISTQSDSTLSPHEQAVTPEDEPKYAGSPAVASPVTSFTGQAFSYEEPKTFRRTASQRWRDGDTGASPQDFFARAGSPAE